MCLLKAQFFKVGINNCTHTLKFFQSILTNVRVYLLFNILKFVSSTYRMLLQVKFGRTIFYIYSY